MADAEKLQVGHVVPYTATFSLHTNKEEMKPNTTNCALISNRHLLTRTRTVIMSLKLLKVLYIPGLKTM